MAPRHKKWTTEDILGDWENYSGMKFTVSLSASKVWLNTNNNKQVQKQFYVDYGDGIDRFRDFDRAVEEVIHCKKLK